MKIACFLCGKLFEVDKLNQKGLHTICNDCKESSQQIQNVIDATHKKYPELF